jgi:alpha-D-ribose 1-methylphosphonate 5-triphosphate synthase subunit PhnL
MYLIKVRCEGFKSDYWVSIVPDCVAIQRSKKRATVFETLAEAERYAGIVGCAHDAEIISCL